jgi:DNA invertase Pin-like site-specific DNA recombinase
MRSRRTSDKATISRTVAYVRVSTEDQAVNGVSLDAQEARIAAYCTAMGWDVSETIRDAGESAKSLQRPGMQAVLSGLRDRSIGRVVVLKLDRMTRSTHDLAELLELFQKRGAALVSVSENLDTDSACGRMVVNMLGVVAQWERETIAERTSDALAHKRRSKQVYGQVPFGYRREGQALVPVASEQEAIAMARSMQNAGISYREIARQLNEAGVKPQRSTSWKWEYVRSMLRSRMALEAAGTAS